ncbi:MAG: SH3 domain-containing protein [Defluviitaleaceae bacterium]|nr:SH3 domain-containing protein [Defluviitaleaceae bacterium]
MSTRILNQMGYIYAFDAGASNSFNSNVGAYSPGHENEFGPQVGMEAILGGFAMNYNERMSADGIFSWDAIYGAHSYRVYAFRYGEQFPVNTPSNLQYVWAGGFNASFNGGNLDQPMSPGVDILHAHRIRTSVGIETFTITNNTHLMSTLAAAYIDTTGTSVDVTTMGLTPGRYQFRVQALAPPNQEPPIISVWQSVPERITFANGLLSGVIFAVNPWTGAYVTDNAAGTYFPEFVIEQAAQVQVDPPVAPPAAGTATVANCWFLNVRASGSVNANIITFLAAGDVVAVLGSNAWGWYQIQFGDVTGWVFGRYLSFN